MLDFWVLKEDEEVLTEDGAFEDSPRREPDLSIGIDAFHRILRLGLTNVAMEEGLSYSKDAILSTESVGRIYRSLEEIDRKFNSSNSKAECRGMLILFRVAAIEGNNIAVVCD